MEIRRSTRSRRLRRPPRAGHFFDPDKGQPQAIEVTGSEHAIGRDHVDGLETGDGREQGDVGRPEALRIRQAIADGDHDVPQRVDGRGREHGVTPQMLVPHAPSASRDS